MNEPPDYLRLAWIGMAAIAGAIAALATLKWREMSLAENLMTVFVGFSIAIFLVPWLATDLMRIDTKNLHAICGVVFLGGMSSNALMPLAIKKAKKLFGLEEPAA